MCVGVRVQVNETNKRKLFESGVVKSKYAKVFSLAVPFEPRSTV